MSYYSDRLKQYGITDAANTFKAELGEGRANANWRFFSENANGDIAIGYLDPEGFEYTYFDEGVNQGRQIKSFSRIRHSNPKTDRNGRKVRYSQPPKTETFPFITPAVINAFRQRKLENDTLYIVEGEFKAFRLSMEGVPCIGIGGIWNFKNDGKGDIHPDIARIISECKVRRVVMIQDRDCMEVKWEEKKNLDDRPRQFYNTLVKFNQYLAQFDDVAMFFCHVSMLCKDVTDENGEVIISNKGIDDLLNNNPTIVSHVLRELRLFATDGEKQYLPSIAMKGNGSNLQTWFGLDHVENFFSLHSDEIKGREFYYRNVLYLVNSDGKPQRSWEGMHKHFVRVGTEYYKTIVEKAPNGQVELNLVPWTTDAIKTDYANPKEFIKLIPKYDAFTNIPENDPDKYQQSIFSTKDGFRSTLYNRYCPVSHVPQQGEWRTINTLLHHIFDYRNTKGEPFYEMALDYLQMIYLNPTQHLPILCLVSREQATGKTTFLNLLRAIFKENMRILDSERISSKFNGSWAGKLVIGVDESFIDTDKPTVVNRLKMIATNSSIPLEKKGKEAGEVPNFAKLIMCSNDETNFLKIEIEDTRYWIIRVQSINPDSRDPHMAERMEAEIPAFLYYLKNRTLYYKEKTRLWFDPADYRTDALAKIQQRTGSIIWQNIEMAVKQQFDYSKQPTVRLDIKTLILLMTEAGVRNLEYRKVHYILEDRRFSNLGVRDFTFMKGYDTATDRFKGHGRVYEFSWRDFYTQDEWDALLNDTKDDAQS